MCKKNKIDPCGETPTPWYHTIVVGAPLFKESIEISKFKSKIKASNRYMDVNKAYLKPKTLFSAT
jgi:diphthamide synthase (EF-2-diphthine--ammonia ligase)